MLLGVSQRTITDWVQSGCPGRGGHYPISEMVAWAKEHKWGAATHGDGEEDELLVGVQSPALERYREERAKTARLDRLEREGALIGVDKVQEGLDVLAGLLRNLGDSLQREHGLEAHRLYEEAMDDFERVIEEKFAGDYGTTDAESAA